MNRDNILHCEFSKLLQYLEAHKDSLSQAEYNTSQIRFIMSPINKYFTWEKIHRDPTFEEAFYHYVKYGGASYFSHHFKMKIE